MTSNSADAVSSWHKTKWMSKLINYFLISVLIDWKKHKHCQRQFHKSVNEGIREIEEVIKLWKKWGKFIFF